MLITHVCPHGNCKRKVNGRFVMRILGKRVRKYVIDSLISHGISSYKLVSVAPVGDNAVTRSDVWQRVGGGDLITPDYSIIYSNCFQLGDHWPWTPEGAWHRGPLPGIWPDIWVMGLHVLTPLMSPVSAHSMSPGLTPSTVQKMDVMMSTRHVETFLAPSKLSSFTRHKNLISSTELYSNKLWRLERDKTFR